MSIRIHSPALLAVVATGTLAIAGCSDDPVDVHEEEFGGIELVVGGMVVAAYDLDSNAWTDEIDVAVGGEVGPITVFFVAHDGERVDIHADDYLAVIVTDDAVANFEQDAPGALDGTIHGIAAGQTQLDFRLLHGGASGHADFQTTDEAGVPEGRGVTVNVG